MKFDQNFWSVRFRKKGFLQRDISKLFIYDRVGLLIFLHLKLATVEFMQTTAGFKFF